MHSLLLLLLVGSITSLLFYCNTAFIISNFQKDCHQDNLPFICLNVYNHNCPNKLAGNICFYIQVKNQ